MKFIQKTMNNWSIFYKLLFYFFIVIFVLSILTLFNFSSYYKQLKANASVAYQSSTEQAAHEIDSYISNIKELTLLPLTKRFNNIEIAYAMQRLERGTCSYSDYDALYTLLDDILSYTPSVHSVFLITPSGKFIYDFQYISTVQDPDFSQMPWFQPLLSSSGQAIPLPSFKLYYYEDLIPKDDYMIPVSRVVRTVSGHYTSGIILINTDIDYFRTLASSMLSQPEQRILITDAFGTTIFDTEAENIGQPVSSDLELFLNNTSQGNQLQNQPWLINYAPIPSAEWTIFTFTPTAMLYQTVTKTAMQIIFVSIWVLLFTVCIAHIFSLSITRPLQELAQKMVHIDYEAFSIPVDCHRKDEIGQLNRTFTSMLLKIEQLIKENYRDKLIQKELKIEMLQMQINPHFLYNTLEAIGMMAEINDDMETSNMVASLGRILRYSLSNCDEYVLLSEEIYCLNEYISLQKERLTNVEFDEHIDYTLYNQRVIRLLLQPIVENAIMHGWDDSKRNMLISIVGYRVDNHLILEVSDNGKGIPEDVLKLTSASINGLNTGSPNIGLKNVNNRIKLYFGQAYGLDISSVYGEYTTVRITLPLIDSTTQDSSVS